MSLAISTLDGLIVCGYLLAVLVAGLWVGRGQRSVQDYFLADRGLPCWALLLSIVATETSTVTFLSVPGKAFKEGGEACLFLQFALGLIVGRVLIVILLLPSFFRGAISTAYELLESSYGVSTRRAASALFLTTRTVGDGLRLALTALVLQRMVGLDLHWCITLIGVITVIYTLLGGIRSVVWNDCLQFGVYVVGGCCALGAIVARLPGGWNRLWEYGLEQGKWQLVDWSWGWTADHVTFGSGLLGAAFLSLATHGADHMMVQRYLSARSQRSAAIALIGSGLVVFAQFALFLTIGVGLACFFDHYPAAGAIAPDEAFATFIVQQLGVGLVGIILAAVFAAAMSTTSSSLNSSASAAVHDFYLPLSRKNVSETGALAAARWATILFALAQIMIALSVGNGVRSSTIDAVLSVTGFAMGPILGLFLLGLRGQPIGPTAPLIGLALGLTVLGIVKWNGYVTVFYLWYTMIGAAGTCAGALLTGLFLNRKNGPPDRRPPNPRPPDRRR